MRSSLQYTQPYIRGWHCMHKYARLHCWLKAWQHLSCVNVKCGAPVLFGRTYIFEALATELDIICPFLRQWDSETVREDQAASSFYLTEASELKSCYTWLQHYQLCFYVKCQPSKLSGCFGADNKRTIGVQKRRVRGTVNVHVCARGCVCLCHIVVWGSGLCFNKDILAVHEATICK